MNSTTLLKAFLALSAAALLVTPCFGDELTIQGAPQWVNAGTTYAASQGNRLFYGVGSSPNVGDPALQHAIADSRARSEVDRLLAPYLDLLARGYQATATSGSGLAGEDAVAGQFQKLGKDILPLAKIVARWSDRRTGLLFSLAQLEVSTVEKVALGSDKIDSAALSYMRIHADPAFDYQAKAAR